MMKVPAMHADYCVERFAIDKDDSHPCGWFKIFFAETGQIIAHTSGELIDFTWHAKSLTIHELLEITSLMAGVIRFN